MFNVSHKRFFTGLMFMVWGILYILSVTGNLPGKNPGIISGYWPLILVFAGISKFFTSIRYGYGTKERFSKIYWSVLIFLSGLVLFENRMGFIFEEPVGFAGFLIALIVLYAGLILILFPKSRYDKKVYNHTL